MTNEFNNPMAGEIIQPEDLVFDDATFVNNLINEQSGDQDLRDLQAKFQFLPISPALGASVTQWIPANTVKEFHIPSRAKMMRITWAGNMQVYLGRSAFNTPDSTFTDQQGSGIVMVRDVGWRFCVGMRSVWLMGTQAGLVSVEYFVQL